MPKRRADGGDRGLDFYLGRGEHATVNARRCLNCVGTGIKFDRREHGMDESSEPPTARPLLMRARSDDHLNVRSARYWWTRRSARQMFGWNVLPAGRAAREGGDGLSRQ